MTDLLPQFFFQLLAEDIRKSYSNCTDRKFQSDGVNATYCHICA